MKHFFSINFLSSLAAILLSGCASEQPRQAQALPTAEANASKPSTNSMQNPREQAARHQQNSQQNPKEQSAKKSADAPPPPPPTWDKESAARVAGVGIGERVAFCAKVRSVRFASDMDNSILVPLDENPKYILLLDVLTAETPDDMVKAGRCTLFALESPATVFAQLQTTDPAGETFDFVVWRGKDENGTFWHRLEALGRRNRAKDTN